MKTNKIHVTLFVALLSFSLNLMAIQLPAKMQKHFPKTKVEFNYVTLAAPDLAENGAVVPISVKSFTFKQAGVHATEVAFFNEKTPDKPIATFKLSSATVVDGIGTRIKMSSSASIYVFVRMSDGRIFADAKLVKVTIGGCGGGGGGYTAPSQSYVPPTPPPVQYRNNDKYQHNDENPVKRVSEHPVSTFSIDVDTGSYTNIRRYLNSGQLPPGDAVRVEEMINYFSYHYETPRSRKHPFAVTTDMAETPWRKDSYLLRIAIQGYELDKSELPPVNLVFLMDVSGSMEGPDRLPLLQSALVMLSKQLRPQDSVSIVAYAGYSGVILQPTSGNDKHKIINAVQSLRAGGSTNGASGIQLAYQLARQGFKKNGVNRVLLATDGDFNVGVTNFGNLVSLVQQEAKSGIYLTTLGFGRGNYNEHLMEQLADVGNGNYAYIDTAREAHKVLVQQLAGTLHVIAQDVKVQIEFNPNVIAEYRLIGYENRMLKREDFKNDKVDAGDIGAGHTVTALYEIIPVGSQSAFTAPLRYINNKVSDNSKELGYLKLRYKLPGKKNSTEIVHGIDRNTMRGHLQDKDDDFRFMVAVSAFGQWLRESKYLGDYSKTSILKLAQDARGNDENGYRNEFVQLMQVAFGIR